MNKGTTSGQEHSPVLVFYSRLENVHLHHMCTKDCFLRYVYDTVPQNEKL